MKSTKLFIFHLRLDPFEFTTINKFVLYGNILKYNNQMQIMPNHMNMSPPKVNDLILSFKP
jgi:hypothetical protein